jgi:hypothetical protein
LGGEVFLGGGRGRKKVLFYLYKIDCKNVIKDKLKLKNVRCGMEEEEEGKESSWRMSRLFMGRRFVYAAFPVRGSR